MSFITSLISVSSIATWMLAPFNFIFLALDGIVYSLVAYSYTLFMLMAQLNFDVIYSWVAPLVDRVKAIILVVIMFKLGISFIQYMVNPEKLEDKSVGGPKLVTNLFIVAALLVSYTLIFSILNEISLLIIGVPENYEFTTLKDLAGVESTGETDAGLLSRFIFGAESNMEVKNFGKFLSISTLSIFVHGKNGISGDAEDLYSEIMAADESDFDMMKIVGLTLNVDKTVEYKWPLLSTAMGLYLVYSIVKIAIEVGVRMFKLIILQILAPIAIISIIDGGMKSKVWGKYIDTLWKTFLDVFIRVGSMFLVTAFISKFYASRSELFDVDGFTGFLVLILVIVAGYRLAQLLPAWLDSIFGSKLSENNKKGFGGFLGAVGGGMIGAGSGLMAGLSSKSGFTGTLGNTFAGAFGGAASGSKGKNVSDFFKNVNATGKANRERALNMSRIGGGGALGGLTYGLSKAEGAMGFPARQGARASVYEDSNKALDAMVKARKEAIADRSYKMKDASGNVLKDSAGNEIKYKYGTDRDSFASKAASRDFDVRKAEADYQSNKTSENREAYYQAVDIAEDKYKRIYDREMFSEETNSDATVREATRTYDNHARADKTSSSSDMIAEAKKIAEDGSAGKDVSVNSKIKDSKKYNSEAAEKVQNRGASRRANRPNIYGK